MPPLPVVPMSADELLDHEWLRAALDDIGDDDNVVSVERTGTSKTRAEKLRFAVTVDGPGGRRVQHYCAKAHLDGVSGVVTEARFYIDVAPRLDMRMPVVHHAAIDGENAIIVMEDVVAAGGEFMSPHRPLSVESARSTLSQLACLHGSTWGLASIADIPWIGEKRSYSQFLDATRLQQLLDDGRAEGLPAELRSGANLVAALEQARAFGTTCLLHGDTHTGNVYLDAQGRGCWFDWESVQTGHWCQDVSYHLATVLSIEDRRAHERELLGVYLDQLAAHGGPAIGFDEAWELYRRSFPHGYLFWVITVIRGRDEVLAHMPRLGAALVDHDTYRLLGVV
jgi:hypothetical protein